MQVFCCPLLPPVPLRKLSLIWSKGSTEKKPALRTSSTRRQPAWKISSKVDTREARVRSGLRVLARLGELARRLTRRRFAARFFDQRQTFIIATPQETLKSEIAQRVLLRNERFLAPCPNYILSPDAVISRVDTALVRGQISLDLGWLSR